MAKITIEELSGSLKEYLNGLGLTEAQVQELIDRFEDEKIGDISQLSTQEKGNLVGAINELFQSANNGKQIIADAIGSPLTEGDTFAAMGNEINQMTIDFRNALAAKGVNAPTDKMESLITRISEIVQSGNIVNNQCMISGEYTLTSDLTAGNSRRITTNLSFNPEYFVVYIPSLSTSHTDSDPVEEYVILTTDDTTYTTYSGNIQHFNSGDRIVAYSDVKITLTYSKSNFNIALDGTYCNFLYIPAGSKIKWYAIGSSQLPNNGGERTITPSTTDQVLPDGYYSGDITVKGDSDLKPENIVEGVEIFGVIGNLQKGKKVVTGTATTQVLPTNSYRYGRVVVDTLDFKPSFILCSSFENGPEFMIYWKDMNQYTIYKPMQQAGTSANFYTETLDGQINDNGFDIILDLTSAIHSWEVKWMAIE